MFLEKAPANELVPMTNKGERFAQVLSYVIRPLVTADWWENILALADKIAQEVPAYRLRFDKSGAVVDLMKHL